MISDPSNNPDMDFLFSFYLDYLYDQETISKINCSIMEKPSMCMETIEPRDGNISLIIAITNDNIRKYHTRLYYDDPVDAQRYHDSVQIDHLISISQHKKNPTRSINEIVRRLETIEEIKRGLEKISPSAKFISRSLNERLISLSRMDADVPHEKRKFDEFDESDVSDVSSDRELETGATKRNRRGGSAAAADDTEGEISGNLEKQINTVDILNDVKNLFDDVREDANDNSTYLGWSYENNYTFKNYLNSIKFLNNNGIPSKQDSVEHFVGEGESISLMNSSPLSSQL